MSEALKIPVWKRDWFLPGASLLLLILAVYWPSFGYEFLNWDDPWYVINNPYNKSWAPSNLKGIAVDVINRNYAPLTMFVLLVEHTVFGIAPAGYHVFNTLLHVINAVLVYVLITQLTGRMRIGFWTAALFAVHPVQLESVVWVSSLKGLLCSTFILAHLICCLRPQREPKRDAWGLLWFGLALLSKALTIVVPVIVWLYDVLVCKQKWADATARQFIPGLLSVWLLMTTMQAQEMTLGGLRGHFELSKPHILAVDTVILWEYVGKLLCPTDLCVLYDPPTHGIAGSVAIAALGWAIVAGLAWRLRDKFPLAVVGVATWLILLLPVLNLTRITTLMNDRYLYLPAVPFFALLVCGIERLISSKFPAVASPSGKEPTPRLWQAVPVLATLALTFMTSQYMPVWSTDQALWEHTLARLPHVPVVRIQYAWMLRNQGRIDDGITVLRETNEHYKPDDLDRARIEETIEEWRSAT